MYYVYPALFKPNPTGGYIVSVPDAPGCITGGKNLKESLEMIKDALAVYLCSVEDHDESIPPASKPFDIGLDEPDSFTTLIEIDTVRYRSETDNKSIRKNVSLPAWLNFKAEQANINFSQALQEVLRERLHL
jgi:predicted RNase H-like HicB family nuclease